MGLIQINYNKYTKPEEEKTAIELPGSKSMAARKLILDYIEGRPKSDFPLPLCDDTERLAVAIDRLRDKIPDLPLYMRQYNAMGNEGKPIVFEEPFDLGDGGTSFRFFIALFASIPGVEEEVTCSPQMARRPIAPLIEALTDIGAQIKTKDCSPYPPFVITGKKLETALVNVGGEQSSQYASALFMASLLWGGKPRIYYRAEKSKPYMEMTVKMMEVVGDREIEPDWSAASYFYELLLMSNIEKIEFARLTPPWRSVQGDAACAEIFGKLGIETIFREDGSAMIKRRKGALEALVMSKKTIAIDLSETPDLAPSLAVGMALAGIRFRLEGLELLRYKESNRLVSLKNEMEKIGIDVAATDSTIQWNGAVLPVGEGETIDSWGDHRIVMAFAPVAAQKGYISIKGWECVRKSFPEYFVELEKLGFKISRFNPNSGVMENLNS